MSNFDYDALETELLEATSIAFAQIIELTARERLYAFGLYTSGGVEYIVPTANTEEALSRKAEEYVRHSGGPVELHQASLKWSPCDWEYHLKGQNLFNNVQKMLGALDGELVQDEEAIETVEAICLGVLLEIKQQAGQSIGKATNGIHFNLFRGDQSDEERIQFAKILNDRENVAKFRSELKQGHKAFFKLSDIKHKKNGTSYS